MSNKSVTALMDQVSALFPPEVVAVAPGACTAELAERLKANPKKEWMAIFEDHAHKRAEEACHLYKDGDLFYRNGDLFACMYSVEFDDALKLAGHVRRKRPFMEAAYSAFVEAIEAIRVRRLGPADQRHLLDLDTLEWSPTFFDKHGAGDSA